MVEPEHWTTLRAAPWAAADVVDPAVAGDIGHHLDAHALEVFADQPDLAGQVEVAEDIDAVFGDAAGVAGADQAAHGLAGGLVALPLVALEPFGLHRQDRDALFLGYTVRQTASRSSPMRPTMQVE